MTTDRLEEFAAGPDDALLADLFAEARAEAPEPLTGSFRARLVADALEARTAASAPAGWRARFRTLLADFGGMPSLASVGAAGLAGVWIGFAAPGSTSDLVSTFWQGAASVSPSVSGWASDGGETLALGGGDLLTLIGDETQ
ncbi:MAG: hypothetical protein KDK12_19780 [Rhodobacteraceae bacterium]|nr:hypothetical protein [Paracoccaceae bacterium]